MLRKNKQEALQSEIDLIETDLKADLEQRGVDELNAKPFTVIWKLIYSTQFDSKRCRVLGGAPPDLQHVHGQ